MKINNISPDTDKYLQILTALVKKPKVLHVVGKLPETRIPTVAIVGTRKPTSYGKEVTTIIAGDLAARGVVIVSGLALGVDGIAHRAALEAGGTTIAVLGNGLPNIYPASHRTLGEKIINSGGALISEYDEGSPAMPYRFLERNRLVSGLADAVIVTEAAARSGTLNTVASALEQGKDVFVVPGNITSPMSAGCNALLRQGAMPIASADDVLEVIAPDLLKPQTSLALGATPEETVVIELLKSGLRDGDDLLAASKLDTSTFSQTMTMLEIGGVVRGLGANQWTLR